jgi:hypothetical protein
MSRRQRIEARAARQTDPRKADILRRLAEEEGTIGEG